MASITISQATIGTVTVLAPSVTISGAKNNVVKPETNGSQEAIVQTQSYNNPKYAISGIKITNASGTLTYEDVLELYKTKYDSTNYATLLIKYGSSDIVVPSITGATTGIKVILDSYDISYDATNSKEAYQPVMNLVFTETR